MTSISKQQYVLSEQEKKDVDLWVKKHPKEHKQSALIATLKIVQQKNNGWLEKPHIEAIAAYLDVSPMEVYEVATFYSMIKLKPAGKFIIEVCSNISCILQGAEDIIAHLEQKLGIKVGETTQDKRFTLKDNGCLAACTGAPVIVINNKYHENITIEKLDQIIDELIKE